MRLAFDNFFEEKGFTVIELLVVFSLTAVVSSLGIVSFVSYSRTQQLVQSANQTKLLIQEAKFSALSSVKPSNTPDGSASNCTSGVSLLGYRVTVNEGTGNLDLSLLCSNGQATAIKTIELPNSLSFDQVLTTCTHISFDALTSQATGSPLPCDIVITGFSMEKTVSIDLGGNIAIQ